MASSPSHIGHSNFRAQGASGFQQWVKKHLFGNYTVKSVQPNPNLSVKEKVIRTLIDSCQWLKNNVYIPIAQRVVIWVTPKSPIEKIMTQEQNDLSQVIEEYITLLIPSRFQRMFLSTEQLRRTMQSRCDLFIDQYYQTVKTACDVALNNNTMNPADRLRLLAGLRKTLIAEHIKWVDNCHSKNGEFFKRATKARCYSVQNRHALLNKLDEHLNNLIIYVEEHYCEEVRKCLSIGGTLTDLQEEGHISQRSIHEMEKGFRELYQRKVRSNTSEATQKTYQIPTTSTHMNLPRQFESDCINRRGIENIHFGDHKPLEKQTESSEEQEEKIKQRTSDFLQYLGEITNNNQSAIYTILVNSTQSAQNNMSDLVGMTLQETLGLELLLRSGEVKRHMDIHPDKKDPNKIVITHSLTVCHNPESDPKEEGPNGLLPEPESLISGRYSYMSDYAKHWLWAEFKPSMKIIVDLENPEQATVEPLDITVKIP